jgi:hypothetical protein
MSSAIPISQQASALGGQRGALLGAVFPTSPVAPTDANRTRAQGVARKSAASVAAEKVAARLAANQVKPTVAPVRATRENTLATQSAGTINTNYTNSAAAQGYAGVKPPDIFRGMREGQEGNLFGVGITTGARDPLRSRESFRNQVFTPPPSSAIFASPQQQAFLHSNPLPQASNILRQPLSPQVGQPAAQFPPRQQFLNYLFPR